MIDALIIGGGLAGWAGGHALARAGFRVAILERARPEKGHETLVYPLQLAEPAEQGIDVAGEGDSRHPFDPAGAAP